jgi:hypothetical protein
MRGRTYVNSHLNSSLSYIRANFLVGGGVQSHRRGGGPGGPGGGGRGGGRKQNGARRRARRLSSSRTSIRASSSPGVRSPCSSPKHYQDFATTNHSLLSVGHTGTKINLSTALTSGALFSDA